MSSCIRPEPPSSSNLVLLSPPVMLNGQKSSRSTAVQFLAIPRQQRTTSKAKCVPLFRRGTPAYENIISRPLVSPFIGVTCFMHTVPPQSGTEHIVVGVLGSAGCTIKRLLGIQAGVRICLANHLKIQTKYVYQHVIHKLVFYIYPKYRPY